MRADLLAKENQEQYLNLLGVPSLDPRQLDANLVNSVLKKSLWASRGFFIIL